MTRKFTLHDSKKIKEKLIKDNQEILKIKMVLNILKKDDLKSAGKIIQAYHSYIH